MTDIKKRALMKSLATGGGIIGASGIVPHKWMRPIVDTVVLPTHAQTSVNIPEGIWEGTIRFSGVASNIQSLETIGRLALNTLIPPAHACLAGPVAFRLEVIAREARLLLVTGNVLLASVLIQALVVRFLLINISGQLSDIIAEYLPVSNEWKIDVFGQNDGFECLGNDASGFLYPVSFGP